MITGEEVMEKATQKQKVLKRLSDGEAHKTSEFIRRDYILRPSQRIIELNEDGHDIRNLNVNEDGNPIGEARYKMFVEKVNLVGMAEEVLGVK